MNPSTAQQPVTVAGSMTGHPVADGSLSACWEALRAAPASADCWQALMRRHVATGGLWQARHAGRQAARLDPTRAARIQAELADLAAANRQSKGGPTADLARDGMPGGVGPMIDTLRRIVAAEPGDWLGWLYLARLLLLVPTARVESGGGTAPRPAGDPAGAAMDACARAVALEIVPGETHHWLGLWRLEAGDPAGAVSLLSGLLDRQPVRHASVALLAHALEQLGDAAGAEHAYRVAARSQDVDFLVALAERFALGQRWQPALDLLRRALSLAPAHLPAWLARARIESRRHALLDLRHSLSRLRQLAPDLPEVALLEAGLEGRMGDARGYRRALERAFDAERDPLSPVASRIAMMALYDDRLTAPDLTALHRRHGAALEARVGGSLPWSPPSPGPEDPHRRLRLGYLSADLHGRQAVGSFLVPVLDRHDRDAFEVVVYHDSLVADELTARARRGADHWRETAGHDDDRLTRLIRADGIDVLVDLAGHSTPRRLGVLARRCAPVQIGYLGYPHTTGLSTMDWIMADAVVAPHGHEVLFTEGLIRLPGGVLCWAARDERLQAALPPQRPQGAPLVFGSFNSAMKLTRRTVALWSQVLRALPDSRLLLQAPSFAESQVRRRFLGLFSAEGVDERRVDFEGPLSQVQLMQAHGRIDIALDTVPFNGGVSTLQALWMGVPVVTRVGTGFPARLGASVLTQLGRPEWIAVDDAGFVGAALRVAVDLGAVRAGRGALRQAMSASPLTDIEGHVGALEAGIRAAWIRHCGHAASAGPSGAVRTDRPARGASTAGPVMAMQAA